MSKYLKNKTVYYTVNEQPLSMVVDTMKPGITRRRFDDGVKTISITYTDDNGEVRLFTEAFSETQDVLIGISVIMVHNGLVDSLDFFDRYGYKRVLEMFEDKNITLIKREKEFD